MKLSIVAAAAIAAVGLGACGGKPSAVAGQGAATPTASAAAGASDTGSVQQTALVDGKPIWAANRRHSAEENAQYQFARNGGQFGARSERDYILKVHAFVERPPNDAQYLDRANGDRLIYAPGVNTFAVVSREGAPRTMFKPRTGAAYWAQQKAIAARSADSSGAGGGQG